jgi:clostripain
MIRLLMVLAAAVTAAAEGDDEAKKDLDRLQGEWRLVSATRDGKPMAEDMAKAFRTAIKGDRFTVSRDGKAAEAGALKLDPSQEPRAIDLTLDEGKRTALGIYELSGDTYKLCYAPPGKGRPREFAAGEGTGRTLSVWRRAKAAAPGRPAGAVAPGPKRSWTVLVYGAVDNSADDPLVAFLDKVRRAIDDDPGVELLLFIDRGDRHKKVPTYLGEDFTGTRLYRLTKDTAERRPGGAELPEITLAGDVRLNSADAANVGRFITWGKAHYPAERYALMIYSHANGRTMCPCDRAGDNMGFAELTDKVGAEGRVDFLALELCNMGGIEPAYQWRPGNGRFEADVLLAIPNAGPPLDWDRAFARLRTPGHEPRGGPAVNPATMTAAEFGKLVIEEGRRGRLESERTDPHAARESAGCYDLRRAADVKKAVDALAVELAKAGARDTVLALRGPGPSGAAITYSRDGTNVDLYDLCRRIADCDRLPGPVRERARGVTAAVARFMIASFGMGGYKGFEAGKNGVYIVLPSGKPGCWRQFHWYTPLKGDGKSYGRLSFLRDGATPGNGVVENWFELHDLWFDEADDRGGLNGYRP